MTMESLWYPKAVLVKGFPTDDIDASVTALVAYFTDSARSGGGPLDKGDSCPGVEVVRSQKEAIVAFQQEAVATAVLNRLEHSIRVGGKDYPLVVSRCLVQLYKKYFTDAEEQTGTSVRQLTHHFEQQATGDQAHSTHTSPKSNPDQVGDGDSLSTPKQSRTRDTTGEFQLDLTVNDSYAMADEGLAPTTTQPAERQTVEDTHTGSTREATPPQVVRPKIKPQPFQSEGKHVNDSYAMADEGLAPTTTQPAERQTVEDTHTGSTREATPPQVVRPKIKPQPFQSEGKHDNARGTNTDSQKVEILFEEPVSDDILELYFENKKQSGGGPIKNIEFVEDGIAVIEFEYESDAAEVLGRNTHKFGNHKCIARPYREKITDPLDVKSGTIIVTGVKPPLTLEVLALWLESGKNGGGPILKINDDDSHQIVAVEFENHEHAENMIETKSAKIVGVTVTFSRPVVICDEEDEEEKLSIVVTGFKVNPNKEVLMLFFENEKKSGGGELQSIEVDKSKAEAIVTFQSEEVANRVLRKKDLKLQDSILKVERRKKYKWDGKSVQVYGIDSSLNAELLTLIFESRKKSGGGPVSAIQIDKNAAIVQFVNSMDAQRVLEKGTVEVDSKTLKIRKPNPELSSETTTETAAEVQSTEVLVLGLPSEATVDVLEMLFENPEKSGGGAVKDIKLEEEWGTATVNFEDPQVASRVASRGTLAFCGGTLHLELKAPAQTASRTPLSQNIPSKSKEPTQLNLEVTGIPENINEEFLTLFFESAKNSGGGPIQNLNYDADTGTAVISFKDDEVVKKVMERYQDQGLTIQGARLRAQVVDGSRCGAALKGSCAIEVKGQPVNCTEDMIRMFFENRRKSGGDDIEEMVFFEDSVVITFASNDVAARVCAKHRTSPLKLENMLLEVKHLKNGHRPKLLLDETIVQPSTLFLQDLPDIAEQNDIKTYLQKVPKCEVQDIWFGVQKGRAIAFFYVMPEYQKFYQMCSLTPLLGKMIGVQCVEKPKSIEVYGINNLTEQKLEMYFEHKRSGGGTIQEIEVNKEEDYAIITFFKYGVAENVVRQKSHVMEKTQLEVGLHYECLGILPPGHDRSTPKGSLPDDLIIQPVDTEIIDFLAKTSNRSLMDDRLNTKHAQLDWQDGACVDSNAVTIKCTLTASTASKKAKEAWQNEAKDMFQQVYDLYGKDVINVLQDGWQDFNGKLGQIDHGDDSFLVEVDHGSCTITVIGKQMAMQQLVNHIYKVKAEVEQALLRKKEAISEDIRNLPMHKVKFVQATKFSQRMKQQYPAAQVSCNTKEKKIVIKGLPDEVMNIKLQMYEMLNEIKSETFDMTPESASLLKQSKVREYLIKQFQERDIIMMWEVEKHGKIMVYAQTPEDLTSGIAIIRSSITEVKKDIGPENEETLFTKKFSAFIEQLKKDYEGEMLFEICDDASYFKLVCVKPICDAILESIIMFLEQNTILEQFITTDEGTLKYVTTFKKSEVEEICKRFNTKVEPRNTEEKTGILMRGTKEILKLSVPPMVELASNIVMCSHGINKIGMPKYFLSTQGRDYLDSVEYKNQVVIITGGDARPGVAEMIRSVTPVSVTKPKVKSKLDLGSGHCIYVVQGDLTEYKVDVIVNAANEDLQHVGGIAKAIIDKGGHSIQEECSRFVRSRGRLRTGRVYASDAGKLPCRKIIHTVGPKWEGGGGDVENMLYEAIYATLEGVQKLQLQTVGIPAISSGVFGFPTAVACKTIIEAISDFCREDTQGSLTEIHLVDPGQKVVNVFHEELCGLHGSNKVTLMGAVRAGGVRPSLAVPAQASASPASPASRYWSKGSAPYSLKSKEGIQVASVKGEIAKQQADVIVNTTSKDLNLNVGGVSASIAKAAGPSLQQEVNQVSPGGIARGQIVITSGGNILCRQIYHGSLPHWKDNNSVQILRQFMNLCLSTAHRAGMSSIAIPAIGTGNLGYPRDKVAAAMFDEVKQFSTSNPGTTLTDVRFLVYDQPTVLVCKLFIPKSVLKTFACDLFRMKMNFSTVQSFEAELDKLEKNMQPPPLGKAKRRLKTSSTFDSLAETGFAEGASARSRSGGSARTRMASASAVLVIKDKVTVQVAKGDITEESSDAIVNSTDSTLGMASQVSRAILRKAGYDVELECQQIGKTDKHGIAVTGAGNLKCRHIIHVATPHELDSKWKIFQKWGNRIEAILKRAVELQCTSVSLPALGTGTLSLDASDIAETIITTIVDFCKKMKDCCLKLIRIVVFQDNMVSTFQRQLEACSRKNKSYLKMLTDYIMGESDEPNVTFERSDSAAPAHTSKLLFHIYAGDQKSIDEVTRKIDRTCDTESREQVLDSKKDQEAIKNLTTEQTEVIRGLGKKHGVNIEVQRHGRINKIKVEGRHHDTLSAIADIHRLLREIEENKTFEEHAEILHKQVQWEVDEGAGFEPYPPSTSATIEKAYQDKKSFVEFQEEEEHTHHLRTTKITFSAMEQSVQGNPVKCPVRRKTPETMSLPKNWEKMAEDETYKVVKLQQGSTEYNLVETKFRNSMTASGGAFRSVVQISRIQNPSLYQKYCVHKKHMEAANPPKTVNERELWHGTAADALDEIHATGFNRNFCGRNGTAYGRGVYFATFASLSNGYATPDASGHKHMYLSRVLTGEFVRGDSSCIVPPTKDPNKKEIKYDSVVDNTTNTNIYVIFFDTQAYPEYLIKYM